MAERDHGVELVPPPGNVSAAQQAWLYDHAWRVMNLQQELIRAIDQKTYMLIVMSTLLVSFTSTNLERITSIGRVRSIALPILIAVAVCFFIFSLITLLARQDRNRPMPRPGMVYFGDIVSHATGASYASAFSQITPAQATCDLNEQTLVVAAIVQKKLINYRRAWACLLAEVTVFLVVIVLGRIV